MSVRLIDVAREAGVSRGTASNVFNAPELVRLELRERVTAAASRLGYLGPDIRGRLLRAGKFHSIAVMPPETWGITDALSNPVFSQFLRGVGEVCDEAGTSLLLMPHDADGRAINTALADGFIFGRVEHMRQVEPALLRRSPFAVVDFNPGSDINAVWVDARAGAYAAARHLLDLGHRRFAIMSFLRDGGKSRFHAPGQPRPLDASGIPTDQEKYLGYERALAEAGIDISAVPMLQADPRQADAAAQLLDLAPEATAVLSMSAMQGISLLGEARRRGLVVPRDLSIFAYNDMPEAALIAPGLTTVDGMGVEKGRAAARLVLDSEPKRQIVIEPRLVLRGSTGPAPVRPD